MKTSFTSKQILLSILVLIILTVALYFFLPTLRPVYVPPAGYDVKQSGQDNVEWVDPTRTVGLTLPAGWTIVSKGDQGAIFFATTSDGQGKMLLMATDTDPGSNINTIEGDPTGLGSEPAVMTSTTLNDGSQTANISAVHNGRLYQLSFNLGSDRTKADMYLADFTLVQNTFHFLK